MMCVRQGARYAPRRGGQSVPEYALLIGLIGLAVALALALLGVRVRDVYCLVAGGLGASGTCGAYLTATFDDLSGWFVERGIWSAEGGSLLGGHGEGRIFHTVDADDYTITLNDIALADGNGYGVWFRTDPGPPVNGYTFQYDPGYDGGSFLFRKWVDGHELAPFGRVKPSALGLDDFAWHSAQHQVQVIVRGDTFQAVVDGQVVLVGQDDTWSTGQIGLRTWDGSHISVGGAIVTP